MRPRRERGRPRTSARYVRSSSRRRTISASSSYASSRSRDDHQARGVAVEAVDDPRPLGIGAARDPAAQRVDERAARAARARVDDEARRLVDDEQVLVLVCDRDVDRRRGRRRRGRGRLEHDLLPALEPVALRARARRRR